MKMFYYIFLLLSSLFHLKAGVFYLPDAAPNDYVIGERIEMKVNKLTSVKTQLPYEYYSLPFCAPSEIINQIPKLRQTLSDDKIQNSLFDIKMKTNENCKLLCRRTYNEQEAKQFIKAIDEDYNVNLLLDDLLASTVEIYANSDFSTTVYQHPHRVGGIITSTIDGHSGVGEVKGNYYLNNHLQITVMYHDVDPIESSRARIVGFQIEPFSINHKNKDPWSNVNSPNLCPEFLSHRFDGDYPQKIDGATEVFWTYDVRWEQSNIKWTSRWNAYLLSSTQNDDDIHWFSVINSFIIVVFLAGMVAMIMYRALFKGAVQIIPDQELTSADKESLMWRSLHGDVFRTHKFDLDKYHPFVVFKTVPRHELMRLDHQKGKPSDTQITGPDVSIAAIATAVGSQNNQESNAIQMENVKLQISDIAIEEACAAQAEILAVDEADLIEAIELESLFLQHSATTITNPN